jgi:LacI family transcriptional regulator
MPGVSVTRDDVARRAGVSSAVVSYVLNGGPRPVSAERRARVLAAIGELGYRRDAVAAALSSRRSGTLGLLLPDASNPYFADLARRIEDAAFARGYTILIGNAAEDRDREARHLEAFLAHRVDGVIACLADLAAPLPPPLLRFPERFVLVDRIPPGWRGRAVAVDNWLGGRLAGEHFRAIGRQRLAVLAGPDGFAHVDDRVAGFRSALSGAAHLPVVVAERFDFAGGRAAMARLLDETSPDGVFCCSDALAIGALGALAMRGFRVPDDVALVGYDDVAQAAMTVPPLTTVAQPTDDIATAALALLLDPGLPNPPRLAPMLVVRGSA